MNRLVVERITPLLSRGWLMVTGFVEGEPWKINDEIWVGDGQPLARTEVRSIELHSQPGKTTVAVDIRMISVIRPGIVLVK